MIYIFNFLIFPGFLFTCVVGLFACWIDRKISARLQWRVGPPWYQSFIDIIKLTGKEVVLPQGAKITFLLSPYLGLIAIVLVANNLGRAILSPISSFSGDLIVMLYLLTIPALALIIGASASRNPLASVGASREMKLVLAYELPFLFATVAMIIKNKGAIGIGSILINQAFTFSNIFSLSGIISFLVMLFCIQAKLGIAPFDISECDQELMGGTLIEYSGLPLAIYKLTKAAMLYTLPVFMIVIFLGKDLSILFLSIKYLAILLLIILIKNTNPRLRIDQALRFFWRIPVVLGLIAITLAIFGL